MNASSTFQSLMNDMFRSFLRRFVLVFFDDILVYSASQKDHQTHLQLVLGKLMKHQLFANMKKCEFGRAVIGFLGHVISENGVEVENTKIHVVLDWRYPRNLPELRGFLGLTDYYRKFMDGYANISRPLTEFLKKYRFGWSKEAKDAFKRLKIVLTRSPVLAMPNFQIPFVIKTDASSYEVGVVLLQEGRPIAYFSKILGVRAQLKSISEKELIAICLAVLKWKPYLLGRHFIVHSGQ